MNALQRWEPFRETIGLRQVMDRLFEDAWVRPPRFLLWDDGVLPLDMYQTPEAVVLKASLPGVKPGDVDVTITGDTLTIKGETRAEHEVKKEDCLLQERRFGRFSRSVTLPDGLQPDKAEATFENSTLTLTIPKAEEVKPKSIRVKASELAEGKSEKK